MGVLQTPALPLGYVAETKLSALSLQLSARTVWLIADS